jgi:hypothetical protein
MWHNYRHLPLAYLVAAIMLLVLGVLKSRQILYLGSFAVLIEACIAAFICDMSSGAFNTAGGILMMFGVACIILSRVKKSSSIIKPRSLYGIGLTLCVIGFMSGLIV